MIERWSSAEALVPLVDGARKLHRALPTVRGARSRLRYEAVPAGEIKGRL